MTIPDEVVTALGGYITSRHADTEDAIEESDRSIAALDGTGHEVALIGLITTAFTIAVHRRFAPTWCLSDIIRCVADIRGRSPELASFLNAAAAENQIQMALGEQIEPHPDEGERARAQLTMLAMLTVDYTAENLDSLMTEARELAEQLIAVQNP